MFRVGCFYKSDQSSQKMPQGQAKSSVDAPKLTSTPAPRGRGRGKSVAKAQPKPGGDGKNKENVDPGLDQPLAPLEEDALDAASLSDAGPPQQEHDVEDVEVPPDEDEEDFLWKCHLLEYIEQYPLLYDKAHPDFKNKYARNAAWDKIATALDSEGLPSNLYSDNKIDKVIISPLCNHVATGQIY